MAIKHLHYLQGLPCNIYYPIEVPSLYNDSSQLYEYEDLPDLDGRFLVTGIYGLQELTGLELEGYTSFDEGDSKIYTIGENLSIPRNSKVEVFFKDGIKMFRTQDSLVVNALNGDPMYGIHKIVPIA
jgi:hypothetical protein